MLFPLLLPWFFALSAAKLDRSNQRISSADTFRAKCDSLPYRTLVDDSTCYFAVGKNVTFGNGDLVCGNNLHGSKMYMDKSRGRILKKMFLDPDTYHDATTSGQTLYVLCSYDAQFTCAEGDLALPGRCVLRGDKPVTWDEASAFCRGKGASNVAIHNDDENAALTEIINRGDGSSGAWLLASHGKIWSAGNQPIDYWNWFFDAQTPANLKCSDASQNVVLANNAKKDCSSYGQWKMDDSKNKNYAVCEKNADCPFCTAAPKRNDPEPCIGDGKYVDAKGVCSTCPSNALPNGTSCNECESGAFPDYALNRCVFKITCDSFTNIPGEAVPCYCEYRTHGRITTNGLCRRIGTSKCGLGLIDIAGTCVGTAAIQGISRGICLSQLLFKTGNCVANEMLYQNAVAPTAIGQYTASLDCATQLIRECTCAESIYGVSIRAGLRQNHVVYFNSADQPQFVGDCSITAHRHLQEIYCATNPNSPYPRCSHAQGNIGWTRSCDTTGCVENSWRANTTKCGSRAIYIEGKGGSACFGYDLDGWLGDPLHRWDGSRLVAAISEKEFLALPRVVIVPGDWIPEKVGGEWCSAPGQYKDSIGVCKKCPPDSIPNGTTCKKCENGKIPDYALQECADKITCDSFTNITGELQPCYCDTLPNGRLTTNGLCRRKGTSKCPDGLIGVSGLCVGTSAISALYPKSRYYCLSLFVFRTGLCVSNEMLYQETPRLFAPGPYTDTRDCASQLTTKCGCAPNVYNASIRTGIKSFNLVYINSTDQPVIVGDCQVPDRDKHETYCPTPPVWGYPRCTHSEGWIGWTRAWDFTGCVNNDWRTKTTKCGNHSILISGKGGSQCIGWDAGGWVQMGDAPWNKFDGTREVAGPSEKEWLTLPRVIVEPGDWIYERVKK